MIELFTLISQQRAKKINIKCNHVSYWRSESEKVNEMIGYIQNNPNKFQIERFEINHNTVLDDEYVQSFDIELYTDKDTYKYLHSHYELLLTKYDKYTIDLSDVKFYSLSDNYRLNLN